MLAAAGHIVVDEAADVVLCDLRPRHRTARRGRGPGGRADRRRAAPGPPAGVLPRAVTAAQLDAALRAVAAGLVVRAPGGSASASAPPRTNFPLLTPREAEILTLVGQGLSNKAAARRLGISVHTVKFHLEALFAKLEATSRAEAVAKGLRGGVIEL